MNAIIGRVSILAKPTRQNRDYKEWQTADIVVLIRAESADAAVEGARQALAKRHWNVIAAKGCDRLVEERVREQGGEVWDYYQKAQADGISIRVFPQHFGAGPQGKPPIRAPRVTEAFIDLVVTDIGGFRLPESGDNRVADYRIEEWLFELKDLQEEGLEKSERQAKLAELFGKYAPAGGSLAIDPAILTEEEQRQYFDILSGPIQGQAKSASKQIRATKDALADDRLRGGLIFLNTGYGSFPPEAFGPLVDRFVAKDTTQIEAVLCVSTWSVTNGFDTEVFYRLHPDRPQHPIIDRLKEAFAARFMEVMTSLARGELGPSVETSDPLKPVAFEMNGLDFAWQPPRIPLPWQDDPSSED